MNKAASNLVISILILAGLWFLLSKVDWLDLLDIPQEKNQSSLEKKLGEMLWKEVSRNKTDLTKAEKYGPIHELFNRICTSNELDTSDYELFIFRSSQVNAFAMPDNKVVLMTGLIEEAENPDAVAGVLGHEIGHLYLDHVMDKLKMEIGLSVLVAIISGGGGSDITGVLKLLASNAFSREAEREADLKSVDFLHQANIHPEAFATFLYDLGAEDKSPDMFYWISTHPEAKERAEEILRYHQENFSEKVFKPSISKADWEKIRED